MDLLELQLLPNRAFSHLLFEFVCQTLGVNNPLFLLFFLFLQPSLDQGSMDSKEKGEQNHNLFLFDVSFLHLVSQRTLNGKFDVLCKPLLGHGDYLYLVRHGIEGRSVYIHGTPFLTLGFSSLPVVWRVTMH
jgi:hypothetical protein